MLNPYVILAAVAFYLFSIGGAFVAGGDRKEDQMRAAHEKDLKNAIDEHNANTLIDMEAAAEAASREATARTRAAMIRAKANDVTRNSPQAGVCNLDAPRMQLLISAVEEANGDKTPAAERVLDAVRKANTAGK